MSIKDIPSAEHSMAGLVHTIHSISKGEQPIGLRIGVVTSPYPNLVIRVDNIDITNEQIYLNDYWKPDHYREAKGHIISETQPRAGGGGMAEYASHTHDIHNDYTDTIIMTDTLRVGDEVTVEPIYKQGEQLYYIGQKVVKL